MSDKGIAPFLTHHAGLPDRPPLPPKPPRQHFSDQLPRTVYIFWDKGFDVAPDIVKLCVQSWQHFNPDWDIILLDQEQADTILPRGTFPAHMQISHYADMLRTVILQQHGGLWVDATVLCLKPLDGWLPHIFNQCGFFAFHKPAPDRMISSWFLAADRDSGVMQELRAIFTAYWDWDPFQHGEPPYFWFHYLFEHQFQTRADLQARWAQTPKFSAVPVHQLKRMLSGKIDNTAQVRDRIKSTPVQKLTYKRDIDPDDVRAFLSSIDVAL